MNLSTGVVLAGGEGRRLRPLTTNRPKPLLPAGNRPILEHVLDTLIENDIHRIIIVIGYRRKRIQQHFGSSYRNTPIEYVIQESELGSGHALLQARNHITEPFVVLNGDRIIGQKILADVIDAFTDRGAPTIATMEHPEAHSFGAVITDNRRVTELVEKPQTGQYQLINAGVYALTPDIFDTLAETPMHEGELALPTAIGHRIERDGPVYSIQSDALWADATFPWDLIDLTRGVLEAARVDVPEIDSGLYVAPSAIVHEDAILQPPTLVGPNCEIGPKAVIGPETSLGRNVTVGANTTVQRSVIDSDTRIGAGSTLVECVTGEGVCLGPNTTVPGGAAEVTFEDQVYQNRNLGAVFADRVTARGGTTAEPGTLVGPNVTIDSGVQIRGHVPSGATRTR